MEQSYNAENDVKLVFPKIPKFSKSIIEGKKLELKKDGNTFTKLEFLDGSVYSIDDSLLTLPNGEKFEGVLSNDNSRLKENIFGQIIKNIMGHLMNKIDFSQLKMNYQN